MLVTDDYTQKWRIAFSLRACRGELNHTEQGNSINQMQKSLLERTGHLIPSCCFAHDSGQGSTQGVSVILFESAGRHDIARHLLCSEKRGGGGNSFIAEMKGYADCDHNHTENEHYPRGPSPRLPRKSRTRPAEARSARSMGRKMGQSS